MLRRLLIISGLSVLSACGSPTDAGSGLLVTLGVDRTVIDTANPATITVTVVNVGARAIQTAPPENYGCIRPFVVVDSAQQTVALPGRFCSLALYAPVELAPGDSLVIHDQWAADKSDGTGSGATPVTPGHYRIMARIDGDTKAANSVNVLVVDPLDQ